MDYLELLFALHVNDSALKIRAASIPDELEGDAIRQWKVKYPVSEFVPEAMRRIEAVAAQIKTLRPQ